MNATLWTIGHSTRALDEFLALLAASSIAMVADVRRFPGSNRFPHFNQDVLTESLRQVGIGYRHYPELGGRRARRETGSPNKGWRVAAFNAFADHMDSAEFISGLDELVSQAQDCRTVVMCSEAVPWRCHRRLIADAMLVRGWQVRDIIAKGKVEPHHLTDFAQVNGLRLSYPAEPLFPMTDPEPHEKESKHGRRIRPGDPS
jgi:uncharacterized protein (DUF488 family)